MDDLTKTTIKRLLSQAGIRILRENTYRDTYSRRNYPAAMASTRPIIFDIGANIGQSSLWYAKSFPTAEIHAFEPIPPVFKSLQSNTAQIKRITAHPLAVGKNTCTIQIPNVESDSIQTTQVLSTTPKHAEIMIDIRVVDLDSFTNDHNISEIHILKTDTEGFDLEVIKGCGRLLGEKSIHHIITEASIHSRDNQHSNLFELIEFLSPFGYRLASFYDLGHLENGETSFFNASFVPN